MSRTFWLAVAIPVLVQVPAARHRPRGAAERPLAAEPLEAARGARATPCPKRAAAREATRGVPRDVRRQAPRPARIARSGESQPAGADPHS